MALEAVLGCGLVNFCPLEGLFFMAGETELIALSFCELGQVCRMGRMAGRTFVLCQSGMDVFLLEFFILLGVTGVTEFGLIFFQHIRADNSVAFMAGLTILLIFKRLMNDLFFVLLLRLGMAFDALFFDETSRSPPLRSSLATDGDKHEEE
jgi:hypothetical protein